MLTKNLLRRTIFYSKENAKRNSPLKPSFDMRDVDKYQSHWRTNSDIAWYLHMRDQVRKEQFGTYLVGGSLMAYLLYKRKKVLNKFELEFLANLPARDYDLADYDYKIWDLPLAVQHSIFGNRLDTDKISEDNYVLLYLGKMGDNTHAMKRFGKLQAATRARKAYPIESVFICLDEEVDVSKLAQYSQIYGQDIIPAYMPNEMVRDDMLNIFQNIGCIYVLDRGSGTVVTIIDPVKHTLDTMATRIAFDIGKQEDIKLAREVTEKGFDMRKGEQEVLGVKMPPY